MNNRIPKAAFFDIDGTLVPYDTRCISQADREAIDALREQGILIFIVTGRHICDIDNIPFPVNGAVCSNGAMTYTVRDGAAHFHERDRFVLVEDHPIPRQQAINIARLMADHQIPMAVCTATRTLSGYLTQETLRFIRRINMPVPREGNILGAAINERIYNFNVFVSPEEEKSLFDACPGRSQGNVLQGLEIYRWCNECCDINVRGLDKVVGIRRILGMYHISPTDVIAFGDGSNDIAMLEFIGCGIAMETADDAVKNAADYVTTPADDSGVGKWLHSLNISKIKQKSIVR